MCFIIKSIFDEGLFHVDALWTSEKYYLEGNQRWDEENGKQRDGDDQEASGRFSPSDLVRVLLRLPRGQEYIRVP
jgi:hypothetical protein